MRPPSGFFLRLRKRRARPSAPSSQSIADAAGAIGAADAITLGLSYLVLLSAFLGRTRERGPLAAGARTHR